METIDDTISADSFIQAWSGYSDGSAKIMWGKGKIKDNEIKNIIRSYNPLNIGSWVKDNGCVCISTN